MFGDGQRTMKVVVNEVGQMSIWLAESAQPAGWYEVGFAGTKADCLRYIDENWHDLAPANLVRRP